MPQTGYCTDVLCSKELTELYECHCCSWLICLKHLLEHVEVTKRDKKIQLDSVRNELIAVSCTLELMVERKAHELECEKQLVHQAKTILEKGGCTMEEIQAISEEINQAIVSNRKEETIVKVEPSLVDLKACACNNDTTTDTLLLSNIFSSSSSNHNPPEMSSPTLRTLRARTSVSENPSTSKSNNQSTKTNHVLSTSSMDDENIDPNKNKHDNKKHGSRRKPMSQPCPFTFDGAFGLTKEKHSIELCPSTHIIRGNLVGHLMHTHNLKKTHARRVYHAVLYGKDSQTTKLFQENEVVITEEHRILCPFNNSMIHLIGCCPTQSRKIPCRQKPLRKLCLLPHLKSHHNLPVDIAKEIAQTYRAKLSKAAPSNDNDTNSH